MKGDFTRWTHAPEKHYEGVLKQQGRVDLDADWNEQLAIQRHHSETRTRDLVGPSGAPNPANPAHGFRISVDEGDDLIITRGRRYVDGVLCENEALTLYTGQPELPDPADIAATLQEAGAVVGLVYLDVWQRHLTALDDARMREPALDADTTTRIKTTWQVRVLPLPSVAVASTADLRDRIEERDAIAVELAELVESAAVPEVLEEARTRWAAACQAIEALAPGARCDAPFPEWSDLVGVQLATMNARTRPADTSSDPCVLPAGAGYHRLENQLYRVEIHDGGTPGRATFKWSRENGSVVTQWTGQDDDRLTVRSIGRDPVLGFSGGDWVELTDDARELNGDPGVLVKLSRAEGQVLTVDAGSMSAEVDRTRFPLNPKVRRWDSEGARGVDEPDTDDGWHTLEGGIEVSFSLTAGQRFRTGDYWLIPARPALGTIEWPPYTVPLVDPVPQRPLGTQHRHARLALVLLHEGRLTVLDACDDVFPAATQLAGLFAVGGEGQEGRPNQPLPQPLQVGVARGSLPVEGARVRFTVAEGDGTLAAGGESGVSAVIVATSPQGVADCVWTLDDHTRDQRVEAVLLDGEDAPVALPVAFNAALRLATLFYVGGDGQEAMPGKELPEPLQVGVADGEFPVEGARVLFTVVGGDGKLTEGDTPVLEGDGTKMVVATDANGVAQVRWTLDETNRTQRVEATLAEATDQAVHLPIRFSAGLSIASEVAYDSDACAFLADADTVRDALDRLCNNVSLEKDAGDGQEARPGQPLPAPLRVRAANGVWPAANAPVRFRVTAGGGTLAAGAQTGADLTLRTGPDGIAECGWTLGRGQRDQRVEVALLGRGAQPVHAPLFFYATLSQAAEVQYAFDPVVRDARGLPEVQQVHAALDAIVERMGAGGGGLAEIVAALAERVAVAGDAQRREALLTAPVGQTNSLLTATLGMALDLARIAWAIFLELVDLGEVGNVEGQSLGSSGGLHLQALVRGRGFAEAALRVETRQELFESLQERFGEAFYVALARVLVRDGVARGDVEAFAERFGQEESWNGVAARQQFLDRIYVPLVGSRNLDHAATARLKRFVLDLVAELWRLVAQSLLVTSPPNFSFGAEELWLFNIEADFNRALQRAARGDGLVRVTGLSVPEDVFFQPGAGSAGASWTSAGNNLYRRRNLGVLEALHDSNLPQGMVCPPDDFQMWSAASDQGWFLDARVAGATRLVFVASPVGRRDNGRIWDIALARLDALSGMFSAQPLSGALDLTNFNTGATTRLTTASGDYRNFQFPFPVIVQGNSFDAATVYNPRTANSNSFFALLTGASPQNISISSSIEVKPENNPRAYNARTRVSGVVTATHVVVVADAAAGGQMVLVGQTAPTGSAPTAPWWTTTTAPVQWVAHFTLHPMLRVLGVANDQLVVNDLSQTQRWAFLPFRALVAHLWASAEHPTFSGILTTPMPDGQPILVRGQAGATPTVQNAPPLTFFPGQVEDFSVGPQDTFVALARTDSPWIEFYAGFEGANVFPRRTGRVAAGATATTPPEGDERSPLRRVAHHSTQENRFIVLRQRWDLFEYQTLLPPL